MRWSAELPKPWSSYFKAARGLAARAKPGIHGGFNLFGAQRCHKDSPVGHLHHRDHRKTAPRHAAPTDTCLVPSVGGILVRPSLADSLFSTQEKATQLDHLSPRSIQIELRAKATRLRDELTACFH